MNCTDWYSDTCLCYVTLTHFRCTSSARLHRRRWGQLCIRPEYSPTLSFPPVRVYVFGMSSFSLSFWISASTPCSISNSLEFTAPVWARAARAVTVWRARAGAAHRHRRSVIRYTKVIYNQRLETDSEQRCRTRTTQHSTAQHNVYSSLPLIPPSPSPGALSVLPCFWLQSFMLLLQPRAQSCIITITLLIRRRKNHTTMSVFWTCFYMLKGRS